MEQKYVYEQFQLEFKEPKIKTFDQVMELVSLNKNVLKWYKDLKQENATLVEMPQAYKDFGMTPKEWDALDDQRKIMRNANRDYSRKANEASKVFTKAMSIADKERIAEMEKVEMIIKLSSITINEIPLSTQIRLLMIEDSAERKKETDKAINNYIVFLLTQLKEKGQLDKDPFV